MNLKEVFAVFGDRVAGEKVYLVSGAGDYYVAAIDKNESLFDVAFDQGFDVIPPDWTVTEADLSDLNYIYEPIETTVGWLRQFPCWQDNQTLSDSDTAFIYPDGSTGTNRNWSEETQLTPPTSDPEWFAFLATHP